MNRLKHDHSRDFIIIGTRLYVYADSRHKENLRGLCGNWNGKTDDDNTDALGLQDSMGFGDSWRTDTSCATVDESIYTMDPCNINVSKYGLSKIKFSYFAVSTT